MIRIRISSAFKLPIIDQVYQATEGFLACTCSAGHLHLNEDIIFVEKEYLDERRFYPVITDLSEAVNLFTATNLMISWLRILNLVHVVLIIQGLTRSKVALMTSSTLKVRMEDR